MNFENSSVTVSRGAVARVRRRRCGATLTDVVTVVLVAACFVGAAAPVAGRSRENANRIKCSSNLRQISLGAIMYAGEQRSGAYPRTIFNSAAGAGLIADTTGFGNNKYSFKQSDVGDNNVTASFFLILKTQDVTPATFTCPSGMAEAAYSSGETVSKDDSANFGRTSPALNDVSEVLSYSYNTPFPTEAALNDGWKFNGTLTADYVLAADISPGAKVTQVAYNSGKQQMMDGNSFNHANEGQNVVYCDGHVDWLATPFGGPYHRRTNGATSPYRDNIYTSESNVNTSLGSGGAADLTSASRPQTPWDAVCLPMSPPGTVAVRPAGLLSGDKAVYWIGGLVLLAIIIVVVIVVMRAKKQPMPQPAYPGGPMPPPPMYPPGQAPQYPPQYPQQYPPQYPQQMGPPPPGQPPPR